MDAAICAPVLPAETNASDSPSACRRNPIAIELFGLPRTAALGLSVISITSGASTIVMRSRWAAYADSSPSRRARSCASTTADLPTS